MSKVEIDYRDCFRAVVGALRGGGALLVSVDREGRPNPMTIGWATLGTAWGRPLFMAMIRPSRHTYGLVEETGDFTVNVLPREMGSVLDYCGTESGRSVDKFTAQGLTPTPGRAVKSPAVEQAILTYECRVVQKVDLAPEWLEPAIRQSSYSQGDFHRLYFGEIVAVYGDPELIGKLPSA